MAKQKILVVDDEEDIREVLVSRLEREGYQVIVAEDGVEALERAHLEEPDLILLDIVLPKMDGYQVCRALKKSDEEKYRGIPIMMITARDYLIDDKVQVATGADDYLVKPFETSDLLGKIRKLLEKE